MIAIAKASIETVDAASHLYSQLVNQVGSRDETLGIFNKIKNHMKNGINLYEEKQKSVFKWCNRVTPLLTTYKNQNTPTPKAALVATLDDGRLITNSVQEQILDSTIHFNWATGELSILENRLANYFVGHSERVPDAALVAELNAKVASIRGFFDEFLSSKDRITQAQYDIGDIKVQIESTKIYVDINDAPELKDLAIQSANDLISKCNQYRQKYE